MAKYTLFGFLVVIIIILFLSQTLRIEYKRSANRGFELNNPKNKAVLTMDDIQHLPEPVQRYLSYVGVIGREKVYNFKLILDAEMQLNRAGWVHGLFQQYNFYGDHLTRLFWIRMNMFRIVPVIGLHAYNDDKANMLIKVAGIIPVVDAKGKEMRISDTVTLLNDMCIFAPATLIDDRIQWEMIDDDTVKAVFHTDHCTVSALLYFNEKGELINFISDDRYHFEDDGTFKQIRWSTPIRSYKEINGLTLPSDAEAVWSFPEGESSYFKINGIKEIVYNCNAFE